ncbi:hypothetical protein RN001_008557 [Aquatica leii]|uniref:G-protein coupled receptors family 3 profile domain-containing protein n=1 Tax=Aquatica leii TaxID=1421715 RepID=A0AAN7S9R1_9COLE|nr:hypothetical protein RN001_008557 [Aquatica leii]
MGVYIRCGRDRNLGGSVKVSHSKQKCLRTGNDGMTTAAALLFLIVIASAATATLSLRNGPSCESKVLSEPRTATGLNFDISFEVNKIVVEISRNNSNFSDISQQVLTLHPEISGVILSSSTRFPILSLNIRERLKIFPNRTAETDIYWRSFDGTQNGWAPPFKDCYFLPDKWFYAYILKSADIGLGLFMPLQLNQCDFGLSDIFGGPHRCDDDTTECIPQYDYGERRGGYRCVCRQGFFYPGANLSWNGFLGEEVEKGLLNSYRCLSCPPECDVCSEEGVCEAKRDLYLKSIILILQLICMTITVILALIVFKQRKCKAIASGMWTILETVLLGIFFLYAMVVVHYFEPSVLQCLLERWARELGFIICYGAIILKLYRHLIEFRTRKAHRWVIKDTDLLKYLLIMFMSVFAYMAAYTAISVNFVQENYSLLSKTETFEGVHYESCKPLWWDYVTQVGELAILIFGIHLSYASRNARTQFHERRYLCAAISIELAVSGLFYVARIFILPDLHPNFVLIAHFVRTQFTATITLLLVFVPKFWYQQKQVRSLAQEYSCRIPVDAFKDMNAHGPLTSNNSDADVGEVSLADMNPEDIRAELKRLYIQLEIFKNKTIRLDNPHISKRRGGRKAPHRRFSLQKKGSRERNLYGNKHRAIKKEEETTEAEPSRTPEDSVCSNEGPSAIYNDLPSTYTNENKQ